MVWSWRSKYKWKKNTNFNIFDLNNNKAFLLIQNEKIKTNYIYLTWLARCYIHNKKARLAWELYLKLGHSNESFSLLQLIANDCYKVKENYFLKKKHFEFMLARILFLCCSCIWYSWTYGSKSWILGR
jgi:hypothetical protein